MASKPITIAVMGATGSGKTSFINLVSGSRLGVGDGLESCTIRVETSLPFNLDGRSVALIDTPGFDDTNRSDTDILKAIASFLSSKYEEGTKLAGVIYMHRILDVKAGGISRRNFSLFRALCGDVSLKNVAIVTTFWGQVQRDVGGRREAELRSKDIFFKPVLDKGARMLRHEGTLQSAQAILRHFDNNSPVALQIQEEMVDRGLSVLQTGAAAQLDAEIREEARRHEEEVERARAEHRAAIVAQEEQARLDREREALRREQEMERERQRIREEALRLEQQRIAAAQEQERVRRQHEEEMRRQAVEAEAERKRASDAAEAARRAHEQWVAQEQAKMNAIRNAPPPRRHRHHGGGGDCIIA